MKKAQIMGQPIIFIFIAIVAILTLALGINYVYKLRLLGEETQIVRELKEIESDLQRVYQLSYQSSERFMYTFPSSVTKICFLEEPGNINELKTSDLEEQEKNYIQEKNNIFIFTEPLVKYRAIYSEIVGTTKCFQIDNKIDLIYTNNGHKVTITQITAV